MPGSGVNSGFFGKNQQVGAVTALRLRRGTGVRGGRVCRAPTARKR